MIRYPRSRPLIALLRSAVHRGGADSLEENLVQYRRRGARDLSIAGNVASFQFYLRDRLLASSQYVLNSPSMSGGATRYTLLVTELRQWAYAYGWHVCFVSFNYDTLLDQACADVWGLDVFDLDSYVFRDEVCSLVKPHGSALWAYKLNDHMMKREEADAYAINDPLPKGAQIVASRQHPYLGYDGDYNPSLPALALPLKDEKEFIWPRTHEAHMRRNVLPNVHRVATIGWRAAEKHFISLLSEGATPDSAIVCTENEKACGAASVNLSKAYTRRAISSIKQISSGFESITQEGGLLERITDP
jgi:hypothetical protein